MKYHKHIIILMFSLCLLRAAGQDNGKFIPSARFVSSRSDSFLISVKPVTNREYIIYLLWLYNVYGADYPEVVYNAMPGLSRKNADENTKAINDSNLLMNVILKYSQPFVKKYMFNPKYLDYPVVGVTWLQANKFCKWLSDRFNEYRLIRDGYFLPDSNQTNEECFVTESYLADQYHGIRNYKKEKILLQWKDRLMLPAFRLPTAKEIDIASKQKALESDFKLYKFGSNDFLKQWNDWYIIASDAKLILKYCSNLKPVVISSYDESWDMNKYHFAELSLDVNHLNDHLSITKIYERNKQNLVHEKDFSGMEKDSLGQMPYIIIDENKLKQPVAVANYHRTDMVALDTSKLYFFRYACAMKPKQYKQ